MKTVKRTRTHLRQHQGISRRSRSKKVEWIGAAVQLALAKRDRKPGRPRK